MSLRAPGSYIDRTYPSARISTTLDPEQRLFRGGSAHVHDSITGTALAGEKDIFGKPWTPATLTAASKVQRSWTRGAFNGSAWTGTAWRAAAVGQQSWAPVTWTGRSWSGGTASGAAAEAGTI